MSKYTSLSKKLKPVKKAWKSLTYRFQTKLHNLNIPIAIKTTTHRLLAFSPHHLFLPFKTRFLAKPFNPRGHHSQLYQYHHHNHHQNQLYNNVPAIYIDQLYGGDQPVLSMDSKHFHEKAKAEASSSSSSSKEVAINEEKVLARKGKKGGEKVSVYSVEDAWNAVVASSSRLRGVDERAEEFIYKFHQRIKLQRERSNLDFQEMLDRSA